MKSLFTLSLGFVGGGAIFAESMSAQVVGEPVPVTLEAKVFDDGTGSDSWWRLNNPAGTSDWFNVDFENDCQSASVFGICLDVWDTLEAGETMTLGLYPESSVFDHAPDLSSPLREISAAVAVGDGFTDLVSYAIPCLHLGSTDVHVAMQLRQGDSATWLGADTQGPAFNRSFASSNAYNTGAVPWGLNWQLGLVTQPASVAKNTFLVNGSFSVTFNTLDTLCFTFWGTQPGQRSLAFFCLGGVPLVSLGVPIALTTTGNPFTPGPKPETWEFCGRFPCGLGTDPIPFCLIYQDYCDLKPNNKPKLKISNTVTMIPSIDSFCEPGCYGKRDDGEHDGLVWKVANPSGPSDWFVVNLGTASGFTAAGAGDVSLTSVEVALTELCGGAPSLVEWVGAHPLASGVDPNVSIQPDLLAGSAVEDVIVPGNVTSDGCYPGSLFSLPAPVPVTAGGPPTLAAFRWGSGDSCLWIASDTDGTDVKSGCGSPLPNTYSGRSNDTFATNTEFSSFANWAIKVNWTD